VGLSRKVEHRGGSHSERDRVPNETQGTGSVKAGQKLGEDAFHSGFTVRKPLSTEVLSGEGNAARETIKPQKGGARGRSMSGRLLSLAHGRGY